MTTRRNDIEGQTIKSRYDSMEEFIEVAKAGFVKAFPDGDVDREFTGCRTIEEAVSLAEHGWDKYVKETIDISSEAVDVIEKTFDIKTFAADMRIAGAEVDVARYLEGEPENMIEYQLADISSAGKVITVVASISYSSGVSERTIVKRGQSVVALGLALNRLGYSLEVWADCSISGYGDKSGYTRVQLKAPGDPLDEGKLLFALAHPAMLRVLTFGAEWDFPQAYTQGLGIGEYYGMPKDPIEDFPEGTIYLPCIAGWGDVPEAPEQLQAYLRKLGIINEEA